MYWIHNQKNKALVNIFESCEASPVFLAVWLLHVAEQTKPEVSIFVFCSTSLFTVCDIFACFMCPQGLPFYRHVRTSNENLGYAPTDPLMLTLALIAVLVLQACNHLQPHKLLTRFHTEILQWKSRLRTYILPFTVNQMDEWKYITIVTIAFVFLFCKVTENNTLSYTLITVITKE